MTEMNRPHRQGFALPATILALVILGGLITGGVLLASQESTIAMSADHSTEAFLAAERGIAQAVGSMSRADFLAIPQGDVLELAPVTELSGTVETQHTVRIRSLGNHLYFVESTGLVTGGGRYAGAAHRTGIVVRPVSASFNVNTALKTLGGVVVSGTGYVSGLDVVPTGWSSHCSGALEDKPGIISSAESRTQGSGDVEGSDPPIVQDPTLDPADFLVFGTMTYDDLVAAADYHVPGGVQSPSPSLDEDGFCDRSDPNNWGAATGPCVDHFPVVHVQGDASLHGDGQGILLVEGDLLVQGGGRFNGIAIVKGQLLVGGGNGGVTGGIIVYNNGSPTTTYMINGNGVALYSGCAVERAVNNAAALTRIYPIAERSWMDLSATGSVPY